MERDIVLRLPHFIVAPEIVWTTDLAVIFPCSIAERFNRGHAFRLLALLFDLLAIEVKIHTHVRFSSAAGIQWLRDVLMDMFAAQP